VWDTAHFFTGDKPSVQFERGTQQGETYKCGCRCENTMMDNQAHALKIPWRSLSTLQAIATKECFGKQRAKLKPFEKLKVAELRNELKAGNVFSIDGKRPAATATASQRALRSTTGTFPTIATSSTAIGTTKPSTLYCA